MASEKISEYVPDAISNPIKNEDLLDFSNEDGVGGFDVSKKITVLEFLTFLNLAIENLYTSNGTLPENRTVTAATFFTKFLGGNVICEVDNESDDYAFIVNAVGAVEAARFGYDQVTDSAVLKLENLFGTWFEANDGKIKIGGGSSAIALIDVEMTAGSDIPLSFYENRVGGANTGDNYEISFDFNDTLGNRVMGTSIQARVDDTAASAGDVNTSLVLSKVFKVASNGRSIFTDAALTAAPTAQLEVRGNVAATTSFLVKSGGNTNAFNPIWIQNLSGNTLFRITGTCNGIFNEQSLSTAYLQIKGQTDANMLYAKANTNNVGFGTATPDASAKVDVSSTTQGFLPPRMTTIQRDAISSPASGLMVFNTTTSKMNFYNGSAWEVITSA